MREPNYSFPAQNRAAVVISSALYDRRALDCTATLPLVNSLTHLVYMTSTSPRIREILAADGGLERLVKILATTQSADQQSLWKWSLAFQCVVNVGVRGTEAIRNRVVETGAVHVVLAILENFIKALDQARTDKEQDRKHHNQQQQQQSPTTAAMVSGTTTATTAITATTTTTATTATTATAATTATTVPSVSMALSLSATPTQSRSTPITPSRRFFIPSEHPQEHQEQQEITRPFAIPKRRTFLTRSPKPKSKPVDTSLHNVPLLSKLSTEVVLHREDDVLFSLQLLAYLSKYPHIRESFHKDHRKNVFSVVEKFTHRLHPSTIIYWAGVIMRNACRKDESRGGIRQCAYMHCGKWERFPREFAKCRRCRKAKYCSKDCQSKAWAEGHRWWCVERQHSGHPLTTTSNTHAAAVAAVAAAAAANGGGGGVVAPQTAVPPTVPLHGAATDVLPISIDERQSNLVDTANTDNPESPQPHHHHHHHHHHHNLLNFADATADTSTTGTSTESHNDTTSPPTSEGSSSSGLLASDRRRRNSRSSHSVPSGSSTEVEPDVSENNAIIRELMEVD